MKIFIISILVLCTTFAHAGTQFTCENDQQASKKYRGDKDHTIVLVDVVQVTCDNGIKMSIQGAGIGARISSITKFAVACFGSEDPKGIYYGLKADAAFAIGVGAAVYGSNKGFCVVGSGSAVSLGAGLTGSELTLE